MSLVRPRSGSTEKPQRRADRYLPERRAWLQVHHQPGSCRLEVAATEEGDSAWQPRVSSHRATRLIAGFGTSSTGPLLGGFSAAPIPLRNFVWARATAFQGQSRRPLLDDDATSVLGARLTASLSASATTEVVGELKFYWPRSRSQAPDIGHRLRRKFAPLDASAMSTGTRLSNSRFPAAYPGNLIALARRYRRSH